MKAFVTQTENTRICTEQEFSYGWKFDTRPCARSDPT